MTTGATIKLLRTAEGISQTHLAERLGISRSYLCQVEKGVREPSLALIKRTAEDLGVPLPLLVADDTETNPDLSDKLRRIFADFLSTKVKTSGKRGKARRAKTSALASLG